MSNSVNSFRARPRVGVRAYRKLGGPESDTSAEYLYNILNLIDLLDVDIIVKYSRGLETPIIIKTHKASLTWEPSALPLLTWEPTMQLERKAALNPNHKL